MDIIKESFWLAGLAFDCLEHYWQVSVLLLLAMAGCATYDYEIKGQSLTMKSLCLFLPLVGSAMVNTGARRGKSFYQWVRASRGDKSTASLDAVRRENLRLKAELRRVEEERDISRKAAAYFAKVSG